MDIELFLDEDGVRKFWRATVEGTVLTSVSGKVGNKGRTYKKDHGTADKVAKAFKKAVAKKRKAGYAEVYADDAPWPLPFQVGPPEEYDGTIRVFALPIDDGVRSTRVWNKIPPQLERFRKDYGYTFAEGRDQTHLWLKDVLFVGRNQTIKKVEPELSGDYKQFPFAYNPHPSRPDGNAIAVAHGVNLYEVDVDSAQATLIHTFEEPGDFFHCPIRYGPNGRDFVWRVRDEQTTIVKFDRDTRELEPFISYDEPILDYCVLYDGTFAVLGENHFRRYKADGKTVLNHIVLRSGFGLGTWLDGRVLNLMTRRNKGATIMYALSDDGLHFVKETDRLFRRCFDLRGAQYLVTCAPGGEVDSTAFQAFYAELAWADAVKKPAIPAEEIIERPSLHDAIAKTYQNGKDADLSLIQAAIDGGADLEKRDYNGYWPALCYAAWRGDRVDIVDLLIDAGSELDAICDEGGSAFAAALDRGNRNVAVRLLEAGAVGALPRIVDVEGKEIRTISPIAAAARIGAYEIVKPLIENGCDPNATDSNGATPLGLALTNKHDDVVELLNSVGAKPRTDDPDDASPLYRMVLDNFQLVEEYLDDLRDDIKGAPGKHVMSELLASQWLGTDRNAEINFMLEHGYRDGTINGLDSAIDAGHALAVKLSLEAGADPNEPKHTANAPSNMLCNAVTSKQLNPDVVKALLDGGADVDALDSKKLTATQYAAARYDDTELLEILLDAGANPNRNEESSWGPLHQAAWNDKLAAVRLLVERGADVGDLSSDGRIPLAMAAGNGKEAAFETLIELGSDPNGGDLPPLFTSALSGHLWAVKKLVELGADVHHTNVNPWDQNSNEPLTAQGHAERANRTDVVEFLQTQSGDGFGTLHAAVRANDLEAVRAMLDDGEDINAIDPNRHESPLHAAVSFEMVELLLEYKPDLKLEGVGPILSHRFPGDQIIERATRLIDAGADLNPKTGTLPLSHAIAIKNMDLFHLLLNRGAEVEVKRPKNIGMQPLHYAAMYGQHDAAKILLERGANPEPFCAARWGGLETPLHIAAIENDPEMADLLLQFGAHTDTNDEELDNYDEGCFNPIHRAAEAGNYEVLVAMFRHSTYGLYAEIARGRYPDELSEDHPKANALIRAMMKDITVDDYLASLGADTERAQMMETDGDFFVEVIEEELPDGTGEAPKGVKDAIGANGWVRTLPGHAYSFVLKSEKGKYQVYVGDNDGVHAIDTPIRAYTLPYHIGPDDGAFIASDGESVFTIDARQKSATLVAQLENVEDVGLTDVGVLIYTGETLSLWSDGKMTWEIPATNLRESFCFGTSLVALVLEKKILSVLWCVIDSDGIRPIGVMDERLVHTRVTQTERGLDAIGYSAWREPTIYRLHNIENASSTAEVMADVPAPDALAELPRVFVKRS